MDQFYDEKCGSRSAGFIRNQLMIWIFTFFNPFMPNVVSYILINWMNPFLILGLLDVIFHFYSNFKRNFCKQTVENLIRRCVLHCLPMSYKKDPIYANMG